MLPAYVSDSLRRAAVCCAFLLALGIVRPPLADAADHGSENVNSFQGAFSYAVPIEVPGFRGLEPRLALAYSSEAGNGFAGVGWSLAGWPVIQRVSEFGGVPNWDGDDTWLLGGVKLLPCNAGLLQSPSCDNGGTHTAEQENLLKVVYDDVADTWTTWAPNGVTTTYEPIIGAVSGSLRYGISSIQDTLGNQVDYAWALDQGDAYPDSISYGNYEIEFNRELRPDPISFPLENAVSQEKYRLLSIVVRRSGGGVIRAYGLTYDLSPETDRSLLAAVQHYGTDAIVASGVVSGGTSLPPQTFTYQEDPNGHTFVDQGLPYAEAGTMAGCGEGAGGDFNGDGMPDRVCRLVAGEDVYKYDVALGPSGPVSTWLGPMGGRKVMAADVNRDGLTDLVLFSQWPGDFQVALSTGSSFQTPVTWGTAVASWNGQNFACRMYEAVWYGVGNFNGDDRPDVWCKTNDDTNVFVGINTGSSFSFSIWGQVMAGAWEVSAGVADFNGDGLDDAYAIGGDNDKLVVRPNTGFGAFEPNSGPSSPASFCSSSYLVGDLDGNGLTDIACPNGNVALSSGLFFHLQPQSPGICTGSSWDNHTVADVDGDGAGEIVCKSNSTPHDIQVYEWTGSGLSGPEVWNSGWCSGNIFTTDHDADTKLDVQCSNGKVASSGTPGLKADLLVGVANGLGGETQVEYTPSSGFPNGNGAPVKYAVTSLTTDDGRGSVATTTFEYSDAFMDWAEGEFRGFGYVKRTLPCLDGEAQCPYVETWLHQDELTAGRPSRVERHAGDGTLISAQDFAYEVNEPTGGGGGGTPQPVSGSLYPSSTVFDTFYYGRYWNVDDPHAAPDNDASSNISKQNYDYSKARYGVGSLPETPASVNKVTAHWRARTEGYEPGAWCVPQLYIGEAKHDPAPKPITKNYQSFSYTWSYNPSSGASWTPADLATLDIGIRCEGSTSGRRIVTQLHIDVEYVPAPPPPPPTQTQTLTRIALLSEVIDYTFDGSGNSCSSWPCAYGKRRKTTYAYDGYGNRVESVSYGDLDTPGDEITTVTTYNPNPNAYIVGAPAQVETFEGIGGGGTLLSARRFVYDSQPGWQSPPTAGRVRTTESWLDVETRWVSSSVAYDGYGNVVSQTDPTGRTSTIAYDATDNLFPVTITNPAGESVTTIWDPLCGVPTHATDANGQVATQLYDALCRLTRRDGPLGTFEEYSYNGLGNPNAQHTRVETPSPTGSGVAWGESWFDGFGRTYYTASIGPSGADIVADTAYDRRGNVASTTQPYFEGGAAQTTTYVYDAFDRPVTTILPDGVQLHTEYGLWEVSSEDAHGHPSTTRYDAYGRKVASEREDGGLPVVTSYEYDLLGRMVGMSDAAGNEWEWMFDSLGRNYLIDDPDAGIRTFLFDDAGRTRESLDALNQKTEFAYDQTSGRLSSKTIRHADDSVYRTISYAYGEARPGYFNVGQLTTVTSPVDEQRIDYDALGRAVHLERDFESQTYELEKRYDSAGRVLGITFPDGDAIGTPGSPFTYDAAGRLLSIPGILSSVSYDAAGRALTQTNANGTVTTRAFDAQRGFLENITTTGPFGTLQNLGYGYDLAGMVTGVTSSFDNEVWSYGYDDLHRLTSATNVTHPTNSRSYDYDVVGNMIYNSQVGNITYPTPGSFRPHAPQQVGLDVYQYDANGQLTQQGAETLSWNPDGSLQGKNATFVYGSGGAPDRLKVDTGTSTSIYPFGDDYEITDGVVTKYVSAPGLGVIAKKRGPDTYWIHTDRQGSVNVVSDINGAQVLRRTYRPYGEQQSEDGSHTESRGYIDQRADAASGLMYLHHRYYDARVGVFVSPDPIGPAGGTNLYAYGLGNPVSFLDPTGLTAGTYCEINRDGYTVWYDENGRLVSIGNSTTVTPCPTDPNYSGLRDTAGGLDYVEHIPDGTANLTDNQIRLMMGYIARVLQDLCDRKIYCAGQMMDQYPLQPDEPPPPVDSDPCPDGNCEAPQGGGEGLPSQEQVVADLGRAMLLSQINTTTREDSRIRFGDCREDPYARIDSTVQGAGEGAFGAVSALFDSVGYAGAALSGIQATASSSSASLAAAGTAGGSAVAVAVGLGTMALGIVETVAGSIMGTYVGAQLEALHTMSTCR